MLFKDWLWLAAFILLALFLLYVFILRPILVHSPIFSEAFKAEASLKEKFQAKITGWKTKIASRLVMLGGFLVATYDWALPFATGQDWTPVTKHLPDWSLPVGMLAIGILFSWLRSVTERPPVVVTQKTDEGVTQVVAVVPALPAVPKV